MLRGLWPEVRSDRQAERFWLERPHDHEVALDPDDTLLPARRKVDAVVVLASPVVEEEQRRLELMGVTIIAAEDQHAPYPNVSIDDETAGRQAMDHLLFLGHRRIAMIASVDPDQPDDVQLSGRSNASTPPCATRASPSTNAPSSPSTGAVPKEPTPWPDC